MSNATRRGEPQTLPISHRYARPGTRHPHVELEPRTSRDGFPFFAVISRATLRGIISANSDGETWRAIRADGTAETLPSRREARDWVNDGQ